MLLHAGLTMLSHAERSSASMPLRPANQSTWTMARTVRMVADRPTAASRKAAQWRHASTSARVDQWLGPSCSTTAIRGAATVVRPDDCFPCAIACVPQQFATRTATPAAVMPSRTVSLPRASCTDVRKPRGVPGLVPPSARRTLALKHSSGRMLDPHRFAVDACLVGQEAGRRRPATLCLSRGKLDECRPCVGCPSAGSRGAPQQECHLISRVPRSANHRSANADERRSTADLDS